MLLASSLAAEDEVENLNAVLEPLRATAGLPSLAAVVLQGGKEVGAGAVGFRELGGHAAVEITDSFHLGSDTKAMTATLAAMMVKEGKINWNTTVGEAFPAEDKLNAACRALTLEQLLTHRAGLPHDPASEQPYMDPAWQARTSPVDQRLYLLRDVLAQPPQNVGEYAYSNVGYAVAGAMLERRAGMPWEQLIRTRLFEPLGMKSAGFGSPGRQGGPLGHVADATGKLKAVPPGPGDDNPDAIGPGATVHCSLPDWGKFVQLHLTGAHGDTALLKQASFTKLHTPAAGGDYAMGWIVAPRPWAGGLALTHAGSNNMFYAVAWLAPEKNFAVLIATNVGADRAELACDKAAGALIRKYGLITAPPPK